MNRFTCSLLKTVPIGDYCMTIHIPHILHKFVISNVEAHCFSCIFRVFNGALNNNGGHTADSVVLSIWLFFTRRNKLCLSLG